MRRVCAWAIGVVTLSLAACGGGAQVTPLSRPEPAATRIGIVPKTRPYAPGFDALHYAISITLPDTGKVIRGVTRVDLRLRDPMQDTLSLDFTGLRVLQVQTAFRDKKAKVVEFRQDSARIHVQVPLDANLGDTLHVTVDYDGSPDDGLIIRKNVHGDWGAFGDNWPDRARFWFPVIDHPSDKATAEFEVNAPARWEVVANGVRTGLLQGLADTQRPNRVWRWRIDQPIPTYLMVIGATDFAQGTVNTCARGGNAAPHPDGCVPVTFLSFPQDSANAARIFRRADQMLALYSEIVAPFPYPALSHVQSATRFGGMENAGAIFYSENAIANGQLGEGTVSHETAHQWFGDSVTPGDWSDVWLSEGFATYFGNLFFERADSIEAFRRITQQSWRGYLSSQVTDLAIVDTTAVPNNNLLDLLNANSYNKGGAVLHMLRGLLGDEVFFAGIKRYYGRFANSNARTRDLQRALEEQSGRDLGWFFEQWVYRPGFPQLRVAQTWDAATSEAVVTVEQVQKAAWPTFRFALELAFTTPAGTIRQRAEVTGRTSTVRVRLSAQPTELKIDPDGWLLHQVVQ
jgi:aminopeptidase N